MSARIHHGHIRSERRRFRRAQEGRAWSVKDLPQYYYHKNFSDIIAGVEADLPHLLNDAASNFIKAYQTLAFAEQCAYARLCGRKGFVFNIDRFDYPEIEALPEQYKSLAKFGFVRAVEERDFRLYLASLTKIDLIVLMSDALCPKKFRKSWTKDRLINIAVEDIGFETVHIDENIWVRDHIDVLDYIVFLHSGHIENGLQKRTLRDLGLIKAPKSDRKYGERFETADNAQSVWFYAKRLRLASQQNDADVTELIHSIDDWPDPLCNKSRRDKDALLHIIGRAFEKQTDLDHALHAYSLSDSELCNERSVRLRYKLGHKDWVKSRLIEMIENPSSDNEHTFARDFYARKFKKKRTSLVTDMLREARCITLDEAFKHQPENAAVKHFESEGFIALRAENRPWRVLFGLLFWDEIFSIQGVMTPSPALKAGTFYEQNEAAIEAKLSALDTPGKIIVQLMQTLASHHGTHQRIFRWGSRSLDRLKLLIEHSPKGALTSMLRLMARNWDETKDGFPDLIIIENNLCKFIEVKAAGDVIRRHQLTRLKQLRTAGYQADILQIEWAVDPDQVYVVVDVETTGGRPGLHRVTEIGAVKIQGGEVIDEWSSLINPQRSIPPNITRLTGITQEMVTDAPIFVEVVDSFEAFMGDAIFAAHNVNFDYGFISAEFQMVDRRFRHPKICTCASMRKLYPGHASYSLKNLCRDFRIDLSSHHRALCDAKAAAELLGLINEKRLENQS